MSHQRILASVSRDEFVGRDAELRQLVSHSSRADDARGLLLLGAPNVGASELLRQAYDELFSRRGEAIPIYFAFGRAPLSPARSFFQSFIQQYIAYRRVDPSLCEASLTFHDLVELALPTDYELISELIEGFERELASPDANALVGFCLSAPQRVAAAARRSVFPIIDCVRLAGTDPGQVALGREIARAFKRSGGPVALAGLRRQILDVVHGGDDAYNSGEVIKVAELSDDDARRLVAGIARRQQVESNEETRDLIVQQLGASPFFINAMLQAARDREMPLTSFLNCQRLYVDELMGGGIHRHFTGILDQVAPQPQTRRTLLRVLHESAAGETGKSSLWAWKKRLGVDATEFERLIDALHVYELANSSAAFVEVNAGSYVWMDYLRAHYRTEVAGESRAQVVADTLIETLKRAPQAMARKYRRKAALGLRELLEYFNCQRLPASLFHYDRFAAAHTGVDTVNSSGLAGGRYPVPRQCDPAINVGLPVAGHPITAWNWLNARSAAPSFRRHRAWPSPEMIREMHLMHRRGLGAPPDRSGGPRCYTPDRALPATVSGAMPDMTRNAFTVAVVGATGVVGRTMIQILAERDFPVGQLRLMASGRSAGRTVSIDGQSHEIVEATGEAFDGVDIALFSAGADISLELAPQAAARGATVIDNSSAWRMAPTIPLVVSQVNPDDLEGHPGIIANPNCSTMQLVPVLMAIRDSVGIERVVVDTYQAVSGSGLKGVDELDKQVREWPRTPATDPYKSGVEEIARAVCLATYRFLGLFGAWVSAVPDTFRISALDNELGFFKPLAAMLATALLVRSLLGFFAILALPFGGSTIT